MRALFLAAFLLGCSSSSSAPAQEDAGAEAPAVDQPLDVFVPQQLAAARVPGVAVAIIKGGKIVYTHAWGTADEAAMRAVQPDTIFLCASISKPFVATSIMQLVEQGKLKLDDDANLYLPFSLRNPKFPDVPITVRMLMAHASSIEEGYVQLFGEIKPGDSPEGIESFLRRWILPGGDHWAGGGNWSGNQPGTKVSYSQVGVAALGLIIERVSGKSYAEYVKTNVLDPIGMKTSSLRLADFSDKTALATPYVFSADKDQPLEQWGAPFYPAATLHSTASELATFLLAMQKGGASVVTPASVAEMQKVAYPAIEPNRGLLWLYKDVNGQRVIGHDGGAPGVSTTMFYRPTDNVGVVTLSNSDIHIRISLDRDAQLDAWHSIEARLFREADKL
ncbi:MAG: serine hydrolase domain-containing protein [Polyangiales bacterium]